MLREVRWAVPTAVLVLAVLAATTIGCTHPDQRAYMTAERLNAGLVVSLDGVGGYNWGPQWLREGLDEAGLKAAIVIYDWSMGPKGMFVGDLVDQGHNREAARELARMVATYIETKPGRPVTLIGHSAGAAIVLWALEDLPKGTQVDRAILLAPALAPDYNMAKALQAVRRHLYVMYSPADVGLMGAGTAVFTTMDGQHSVSAGLVGFKLPRDLPIEQQREYAKVRQVGWSFGLMKMGSYGGHMGWTTTRFAREFIAPILKGASDPGEPLVTLIPAPARQGAAG